MKKIVFYLLAALLLSQTGCDNEPLAVSNISNANAIAVNSDLYNQFEDIAIGEDITCIDFIYDFTLYIFDENLEFVDAVVMHNDEEFSTLLGSLIEGHSISVSYPITSMLENGEIFEVSNNDELKAAIDACFKEEQLGNCQNVIIQEDNCSWTVVASIGSDNFYEGAIFQVNEDGTVGFYHETEAYFGTWIVSYIEEELHLNINLIDENDVGNYWNFDWKILDFTDQQFSINNDINQINLIRNCEIACEDVFTVCEDVVNTGVGTFQLKNYIQCIATGDDMFTAVHVTFFETETDAQNNTNEIPPATYTNNANPQTLFARVENLITGELIEIVSFMIAAENCDEG